MGTFVPPLASAGREVDVATAFRAGRSSEEELTAAQEDGINLSDDVLMATTKEWTIATLFALEKLSEGTLAMGRDTVLGLEDDYAVGVWLSNRIPDHIASGMTGRCSQLRASRHQDLSAFDARRSARAPD